jgi:DNA-binding CsgD family transcriptional regulator
MAPRYTTHAEKAKWAAYMREYRKRRREDKDTERRPLPPTERQLMILRIYADPQLGGNQRKVAASLGVSVSAVHNQIGRLMARLNVNDPSQAVFKLWVEPYLDDSRSVPARDLNTKSLSVPEPRIGRPRTAVEERKPTLRVVRASAS